MKITTLGKIEPEHVKALHTFKESLPDGFADLLGEHTVTLANRYSPEAKEFYNKFLSPVDKELAPGIKFTDPRMRGTRFKEGILPCWKEKRGAMHWPKEKLIFKYQPLGDRGPAGREIIQDVAHEAGHGLHHVVNGIMDRMQKPTKDKYNALMDRMTKAVLKEKGFGRKLSDKIYPTDKHKMKEVIADLTSNYLRSYPKYKKAGLTDKEITEKFSKRLRLIPETAATFREYLNLIHKIAAAKINLKEGG